MASGINLKLMIGPAVPIPVSEDILDALVSVQVVSASGEEDSGFELQFTLSKRSTLQTLFLIASGVMVPFVRVVIIVSFQGTDHVLMDGLMTEQSIAPGSDPGHSILTLRGTDLSAAMNLIDFSGLPYPAMPVFGRVALILAKYLALGVIPLVIPPIVTDIPIPTNQIPQHQGKDLPYLRYLAHRAGYVFYVDPGPLPGTSTAYWGPEFKIGYPQPALNIDMDAFTNVETLQFRIDKERKRIPLIRIQEEKSKAPLELPIPDITPLNPPLGRIPPLPPNIEPLKGSDQSSPLTAVMMGLAEAARSSDAVFGNGTLDVLRYGHVLKSRQLVGVRGAGSAFDGLYYVAKVTHNIKRGEYKQDFELKRNGLISTIPVVPV
jgi:hypothetical protein